ncbi:MAG: TonB-dependent receptor [Gemmatimonadaceae bacterium]|nr:TonB-dependent receptor [Gemmatimonadaceae bacterium]
MRDSRHRAIRRVMSPWTCTRLLIAGACALHGIVAAPAAAAQQATSSSAPTVRIISATDRAPVVGAELRDADGRVVARTDPDGRVQLPAIVAGVTVRALGFRAFSLLAGAADSVLTLVPLPTVLPVFTTTVGQRVIRASESPRSVTVLERRDIDAAAAVSANTLLRQIPGLQEISSPPARTSISIRGFDDARVLVLVDGEPIPGSLMDSRDIGRLSTLSAERIEVTKGPSAVEFGSDAIGGVINLVQAAPAKRLTLDGTARMGELGRQEANVGVSNTIGGVGVRLNGGWRQLDQVTGVNASGSTLNRLYDVRMDVRVPVTTRFALRFDAQGTQERQRWPVDGLYNGFIDNIGGQGFVEGTYRGLGGVWRARTFTQRFSYQYKQAQGMVPIAGSGDSLEQRERLTRALLAYSRVLGRHTLDAGVQYSSRALVAPAKVDGDSVTDQVREVYARDAFALGRSYWTLGVRHTDGSLWGAATNPSIGTSVQLSDQFTVRGNVARGFRAPGFKDIRYTFTNASGGYTIIGNPLLTPESSWSQSLGASWARSAAFGVEVELYQTNVDDLIDTRFQGIGTSGLQTYANVNIAQARTRGVELTLRGTVGSTTWSLGYDGLSARDLEFDVPLSRRARHTARGRLSRVWALRQGLTTDLTARYTGAAPLVTSGSSDGSVPPSITGEQGAMMAVDLQFRQALTRTLELSAGVNNALGQRPAMWTPAFDRQIYAGLRLRWEHADAAK